MTRLFRFTLSLAAVLLVVTAHRASAQSPDWTEPFPPFRVAGNLYYVGSKGLASYLVTTAEGHILINSNLEESVPQIQASVEKLGFKFSDVKILLISHAHWDHDAGSARVKEFTGARYMVMDADVPVVESGGTADFHYGGNKDMQYRPAKVDRVLHDGDTVALGDAKIVAHKTAGHTKGCTTWTLAVRDGAATRNAVIICSPNVNPGYRLVTTPSYPSIAADYERMFRTLESLKCEIFLGAHGSYFDLPAKHARMRTGGENPFVDPSGCAAFIADRKRAFETELAKQRGAK